VDRLLLHAFALEFHAHRPHFFHHRELFISRRQVINNRVVIPVMAFAMVWQGHGWNNNYIDVQLGLCRAAIRPRFLRGH
jgi:hypothetical protein